MKKKHFYKFKTKLLNRFVMPILFPAFFIACANSKPIVIDSMERSAWMLEDSTLTLHILDSLKISIFSPDEVKCHHIIYKETIKEKDVEIMKGWVRDSLLIISLPWYRL